VVFHLRLLKKTGSENSRVGPGTPGGLGAPVRFCDVFSFYCVRGKIISAGVLSKMPWRTFSTLSVKTYLKRFDMLYGYHRKGGLYSQQDEDSSGYESVTALANNAFYCSNYIGGYMKCVVD